MNAEKPTTETQPKRRLAELGQKIVRLKMGEHIIVTYPSDKHPPFATAINNYRKYLNIGFLFAQKSSDTYEVWVETREDAAAARRGLRHDQTCLSEAELKDMQAKMAVVGSDWITVVLLAKRCGIPVRASRHLLWANVYVKSREIEVTIHGALFPVRRVVTDDLSKHLEIIQPQTAGPKTPLCPILSPLSDQEFRSEWLRVRNLLGLPASRTISALTWPWKEANPGQHDSETILNHLSALEKKWLPEG